MKRAAPRIALLLVLLLAAGLRWWQPGLVEFKYDEAHTVGLALDIVAGGPFPLTSGGTSIGVERPALDAYWLAIPLLLGRIEAAVWWVGAFGVLSVALAHVLGKRIGGQATGLLAGLYMAANPWLVLYDRKLWSHIQMFLSVALLLLAWEIVVRRRRQALGWFAAAAILQCLSHLLALLQVLSWLPALALYRPLQVDRRWVRRGSLGALFVLPVALALGSGSGLAAALVLPLAHNLAQALALFGGSGAHALTGLPPTWPHMVAAWVAWPVAGLIALGAAVSWRGIARPGAPGMQARLLLAWSTPLLVLALAPAVYQQYWTVLLPLPALYFAAGTIAVLRRLPRTVRIAAGGLALLALLGVWTGSYVEVVSAIGRGQGLATFGAPLQRWERAARVAVEQARAARAAGIRVAVQGIDPRYEDEPAVIAALLHGRDDVRLVAPGWPYFALFDSGYESEGNVIATEALRSSGEAPVRVVPGYSLLDETRPTVFLWLTGDPGIEETLERVGERVWEGELGQGRPPVRIYLMPSRGDLARRAVGALRRLAATDDARTSVIAVNEPGSLLVDALAGEPVTVLPPHAHDALGAELVALEWANAGIKRIVFVEQPSGWWDRDGSTDRALQGAYRSLGSWPVEAWSVHVYSLPPAELDPVEVPFEGGPRLAGATLEAARAAPGGLVVVHTLWTPEETVAPGLKVSLQLLSAEGRAVAQTDRDLSDAIAGLGEVSYAIPLPPSMPEGQYRLIVVVYDGATGRRLMTPSSDAIDIGSVHVQEPLLR